jgi:hypothetical protein
MAEFVNDNAYLVINSVDLSNKTRSAQINGTADQQDKTAMGQTSRTYLVGLLDASLAVELNDDLAAGSVDATIFAAYAARTSVTVAYRAVNGVISTSNPEYQFSIVPTQWNIGASVGILATKSLSFPVTGAITRDTTP